jgi:phosphatidylglycerophosphatase A
LNNDIKKSPIDYFALAVTTFGVGYIPLAPGTWGSAVAVGIYLLVQRAEINITAHCVAAGQRADVVGAWLTVASLVALLLLIFVGIWASSRATKLFGDKDPQKVVVDEVMGQLIVFLFVPLNIGWQLILAGFILFRLFDIWKPYPIDSLQYLPGGIGVCADDILAGLYGGVCLTALYAISFSL